MDNHWGYRAGGVSEAGFLLPLSMAGLEAVVVEDLEAWEVLAVVCPCAGRQRQSVEAHSKAINQTRLMHNEASANCRKW